MSPPIEPAELWRLLDQAAAGPTTGDFASLYHRAHRQRRIWRSGMVAATVAVVAAAIAVPVAVVSHTAPAQRVVSSPTLPPVPLPLVHTDPLQLVSRWHVSAAGERAGTSLILGDGLTLFRRCGEIEGQWLADHAGRFIASEFGGDGACFHTAQQFSVPWLAAAAGYRVEGPDRVLVDATGKVVARLSPGAHPSPGPGDLPASADAPSITPALRAKLAPPVALPVGLRPASLATIVGRWRALGPDRRSPAAFIQFNDDGSWNGSDGCNDVGGGLAVGSAGELMTTSGPRTLVGCLNSPAPDWVQSARRAGFDGDVLVLFDIKGTVLGRLGREPTTRIVGKFERVGGPPSAANAPLSGLIQAHAGSVHGQVVASTTATNGHFALLVPPGRYVLVGVSRHVTGIDCTSGRPTTVAAGPPAHVTVVCSIR